MKQVVSIPEMQRIVSELRLQGKRIAVVPTMGYFHKGHLSLMQLAKQKADFVITTIFVNPIQFAPHEDFDKYPRDIERDKRLAEKEGTDILFIPERQEMYQENHLTYITIEQLSETLEGKVRPGHFRGVATVVAKLFNITKPHVALFGQKDAQQYLLLQRMVRDLNFDIEMVIAPIVREPDGLAMSSRNVYLNAEERRQSAVLWRSLQLAATLIKNGERDCGIIVSEMRKTISTQPLATIDYISLAEIETLQELTSLTAGTNVLLSLAARFGATRLIDNILVNVQ